MCKPTEDKQKTSEGEQQIKPDYKPLKDTSTIGLGMQGNCKESRMKWLSTQARKGTANHKIKWFGGIFLAVQPLSHSRGYWWYVMWKLGLNTETVFLKNIFKMPSLGLETLQLTIEID